jgi:3D (Asp-Asp-Asp) domain-containing protein
VRRLVRLHARLLVVGLCSAFCGVATAGGGGAEAPKTRAGALRSANATLAQRMQSATLELYALEAKLKRVQARLTSLGAQRAEIARNRRSIRVQLNVSRHNVHASQTQLALLLRTLYERQADDPLAVILGAQSLEDAIATLDDLSRSAEQNRQVAARSRDARVALTVLTRRLEREDARIRALEAAALETAASLTAAERTRREYVATIAGRRRLNDAQISRVDALAQSAATSISASATEPSSAASTAREADYASGARTVTVVATGYSLSGTTSTGLPVGWGTVAVDPSVIPLGTRMTIPGYGDGVAADTGSAVQGTTVDLWFPSVPQALAWGRRLVTVTLH